MSLPNLRPSEAFEAIADEGSIPDFVDWVEAWAAERGLSADTSFAMRLCAEEAVTNIVLYAYDGGPGWTRIEADLAGDQAHIRIIDRGSPFDVAHAGPYGSEADIESATIGGRGIRLMWAFSNGLAYSRVGQENHLVLSFLTTRPAPAR